MAYVTACGGECPPPPDPLQREGFVLRLAAALNGVKMASRSGERLAPDADPDLRLATAIKDTAEGRYDAARRTLRALAAELAHGQRPLVEAAATSNLGVVAALQGRFAEAHGRFGEALAKYRRAVAALGVGAPAPAPNRTTGPAGTQAVMAEAVASWDRRLAASGVLRSLLNQANLAGHLGQYAQAKDWLDQAAVLAREPAERLRVSGEVLALYRRTGDKARADETARRMRAEPAPEEMAAAFYTYEEPRVVSLSGNALAAAPRPSALREDMDPAARVAAREQEAQADALPGPGAEVLDRRPGRYAEAAHQRMAAQAVERERAGDIDGALRLHGRMAQLAGNVGNAERERAALAEQQRLQAARGAVELAIFLGKRAVNAAQGLRASLAGMDRATRRSFLAERKRSPVLLAQLLLDSGRLAEAEQVLRLLKQDEGQQFRTPSPPGGPGDEALTLTRAERAPLAKLAASTQRVRALEAERLSIRLSAWGGPALETPEALERSRRAELEIASSLDFEPEGSPQEMQRRVERIRQTSAKPPAARTPQDLQMLREAAAALRTLDDFLDATVGSARSLQRDERQFAVPLSAAERALIAQIEAKAQAARTQFAPVREALRNEPPAPPLQIPLPGGLSGVLDGSRSRDLRRLWALDRELDAVDDERSRIEAGLAASLRADAGQGFDDADRERLESGRRVLAALPAGTVALYYLGGADRLDVLMVSSAGRRHFKLALKRPELEQRIRTLRAALQDPRRDATGPARELHRLVLEPLAPALAEAGAKTLMLSLDGSLRYLPFAALRDERGWLAERYAIDLYTSASPAALTARPAARWRVAAFGSTRGGEGFVPLPAVKLEIDGIVRGGVNGTGGVLPGSAWLDARFTEGALRQALRERQSVVHIASHFAFQPGDAEQSFLLLGDGGRLSLKRLNDPEFRFDGVDLVALSACETGLSGDDTFGQEVEGLGALLQGQGAASVLATLWSVADDSTAQFMREFYAARESQGLSRAEALQAVQRAFIEGRSALAARAPGGAASDPRGGRVTSITLPPAPAPEPPTRAPFSHPFYWAPFVLMGNWL